MEVEVRVGAQPRRGHHVSARASTSRAVLGCMGTRQCALLFHRRACLDVSLWSPQGVAIG